MTRSLPALFALPLLLAALLACERKDETTTPATSAPSAADEMSSAADAANPPGEEPPTPGARVTFAPTQGNKAAGELLLFNEGTSVRLSGQVTGLKAGTDHAIHIHEKGDCSAPDGSSAGDHFNPTSRTHGHPDAPEQHHSGDMYNVYADDKGIAAVENRATEATLGDGAPTDVMGRSVVVHEKADDYKTQPAGNSGKRIACGVIQPQP